MSACKNYCLQSSVFSVVQSAAGVSTLPPAGCESSSNLPSLCGLQCLTRVTDSTRCGVTELTSVTDSARRGLTELTRVTDTSGAD